jgi:hypothetical protein
VKLIFILTTNSNSKIYIVKTTLDSHMTCVVTTSHYHSIEDRKNKVANYKLFLKECLTCGLLQTHVSHTAVQPPKQYNTGLLGALAKLRKATQSFLMSVRPHRTTRLPTDGFRWNLIFDVFSNVFSRKYGYLRRKSFHMHYNISLNSSQNKKMFWTKVVEKSKHILYTVTFFRKSRLYEITSKNVVEPEGPQMTSHYSACALHAA